jgi:hypothetical protein
VHHRPNPTTSPHVPLFLHNPALILTLHHSGFPKLFSSQTLRVSLFNCKLSIDTNTLNQFLQSRHVAKLEAHTSWSNGCDFFFVFREARVQISARILVKLLFSAVSFGPRKRAESPSYQQVRIASSFRIPPESLTIIHPAVPCYVLELINRAAA